MKNDFFLVGIISTFFLLSSCGGKCDKNALYSVTFNTSVEVSENPYDGLKMDKEGQVYFLVNFINNSEYLVQEIEFVFKIIDKQGVVVFKGLAWQTFGDGAGFSKLKPSHILERCRIDLVYEITNNEVSEHMIYLKDKFENIKNKDDFKVVIEEIIVGKASLNDKENNCECTLTKGGGLVYK